MEAKDGRTCDELKRLKTCGVNPVTRTPGINAVSSGILGELRPGEGGNGNFKGRSEKKHDAIDIRAPVGTPIYACREGVVEQITKPPEGMGNRVILKHSDGIFTHYAHLSSFAPGIEVKNPRVEVTEGQLLGYAGRTGNVPSDQKEKEDHVHFGVSTIVRPAFQAPEWKNPVKYLNECILTTKEDN